MIATPLPYDDRPERPAGTRAGRAAVPRRRARTRRQRYAGLVRILSGIGVSVFVVTIYLALLANVTRMNYQLATLEKTRAQLLDETAQNDDAIANATSEERLREDARILHMHEPQTFAAIDLPARRGADAPHGIAFLGWLK